MMMVEMMAMMAMMRGAEVDRREEDLEEEDVEVARGELGVAGCSWIPDALPLSPPPLPSPHLRPQSWAVLRAGWLSGSVSELAHGRKGVTSFR